jgi:hypothetical protein
MKRDSIITIAIGLVLVITLLVVTNIKLRDAEPEETVRVTEVELEMTATQSDTDELPEESETIWAVVDTAPAVTETGTETETPATEPTETRYLNIVPGDGYLDVPMERDVQDAVRAISDEYGVPFELTMAVCYVESGFDPYAMSSHGDSGLMQIAPVNHGWLASDLGITDLFDSVQNVRAGVHILADKIAGSNGDFTVALMKYNRGDAVALEQMRNGIYSTDYTEKVLGKYYEYLNYGG